ncbi:sugar ABC transporter substrate-binding protein [Deinococcus sp. Arct2-2]|uniref:ABC transporter substrate-binding protein n=1 Tax=Deinococcus sp. Arct2-2 TaxID=2568653 RepID=UPI0010A58B6B|nr:sugar ABC transporter substrate-binding protein [Deinococcus sp. Arct2-2]THF70375.1 sugar ABC transporter substrate-binding protein [Deinococcus sp. Arct2-2]
MKRLGLILSVSALLATSFAGAQKVNLRFSTWAGGDGLTLLQQLAQEYAAQNAGVQVSVEVTPFADYARKVAVQIASGDSPDVGWLAEQSVPTFLASRSLLDLSSLTANRAFNVPDFPVSALSLWKQGKGVYGVPFSNSPQVLFYNKDLFKTAAVVTPLQQYSKGTWDYAAFRAAAKAITDKTDAFGARIMRLDVKAWNSGTLGVLWSHGGNAFDSSLKCALNSPGSVRAFQLMHDMTFKDQSLPRPGDQTTFQGGRLGMYIDNVSFSAQLKDAPFKWGIAPLPKGPAGRVTQLGQAGYVVFARSAYPKEAQAFLQYLASPTVMARTAKFFPPPRKSVLTSRAYLTSNPAIPAADLKTALVNQLPSARVFRTGDNFLRANDVIAGGIERLYQPGANVSAVLNDLCKQVDGL